VIVVGVDLRLLLGSQQGDDKVIGPFLDRGPNFAQFGRHRSNAVGPLTRQLAMLRSVHRPSAKSAVTAKVIAASGMWFRSMS